MSESKRMRVCLSGCIRNAADALDNLIHKVREDAEWDENGDEDDPAGSAQCDLFMLRELEKHAADTSKGIHSVEEFADFYCLVPEKKAEGKQ